MRTHPRYKAITGAEDYAKRLARCRELLVLSSFDEATKDQERELETLQVEIGCYLENPGLPIDAMEPMDPIG